MKLVLDSFWRAAAYCLRPRVIALSLLPLVIMLVLTLGLGYFYWQSALAYTRGVIDAWPLVTTLWGWLDRLVVNLLDRRR